MATNPTGKPWHKITFDPMLPGEALVTKYPRKGRRRVAGQWVVFDKDRGEYATGRGLFASGDINACHLWIKRCGITTGEGDRTMTRAERWQLIQLASLGTKSHLTRRPARAKRLSAADRCGITTGEGDRTMTIYSNPRMEARIENWPLGGSKRGVAMFCVESDPKRGERAVRTTRDPASGKFSAPKKLTYANRVRIVDGDDGKTYIIAHTPHGFIVVMQGGMQYQAETIHDRDPRFAEVMALFG